MRVGITGATGVLGGSAVAALLAAGHDVVAVTRSAEKRAALDAEGVRAVCADLFDASALTDVFDGCDAVVNLATHIPIGYAALLPGAWRDSDRIRTRGVATILAAARAVGVRRVVQESVSFVYADQGQQWIDEEAPIDITPAIEPIAVAESQVTDFNGGVRHGVVLRFGNVIGDDGLTRFQLRAAGAGRPFGLGSPDGWAHVVHVDDVGTAVVAALTAPGGVYNVGAAPVRRRDLVAGFAQAAGVEQGAFLGPMLRRLAGPRVEALGRSLRVCSDHFIAQSGWTPGRPSYDESWFDGVRTSEVETV